MHLRIEAVDPLFFRDGRPFTMGEDDWAGSLFPPPPGVIYGALRSLYFSCHPEELPRANTAQDPTAGLRLKLLYWLVGEREPLTPCFPLPLECYKVKEKSRPGYRLRELRRPARVISGHPLPLVLATEEEKADGAENCLVDEEGLGDYLRGQRDELSAERLEKYAVVEPKIGIGLDRNTLAAQEHKLYRLSMRRLKGISLGVEYEGLRLPPKGLLRLGGEGRAASYTHLANDPIENLSFQLPVSPGRFFKLYLATPAFFARGWLPGWLNPNDLTGLYGGLKLRLWAAAVGRFQPLGGFNMGPEKGPKEMRRAVPAGSVYYFELIEGNWEQVGANFHRQSISEFRGQEGFGIALVAWPTKKNLAALQASGGGSKLC